MNNVIEVHSYPSQLKWYNWVKILFTYSILHIQLTFLLFLMRKSHPEVFFGGILFVCAIWYLHNYKNYIKKKLVLSCNSEKITCLRNSFYKSESPINFKQIKKISILSKNNIILDFIENLKFKRFNYIGRKYTVLDSHFYQKDLSSILITGDEKLLSQFLNFAKQKNIPVIEESDYIYDYESDEKKHAITTIAVASILALTYIVIITLINS